MTIYTDGIRVRQGIGLDELPTGFGDYLGAKVGQAFNDSATDSFVREKQLDEAMHGEDIVSSGATARFGIPSEHVPPDSPMVDQDTAQERIKAEGLQGRLTVPASGLPQRALDMLIERKHTEIQRDAAIQAAPNRYAMAGLPAAIGTQLLDPINVAAAFIPVVGEERFATILGKVGGRAAAGSINGFVGSAAVEPFTLLAHTQEQADYTMADSLTNIAFGSIMGGGLHVGIGAIGDRIRVARERGVASDVPRGTFTGTEQRVDAQTRANVDAMPEARQQTEIEWLRAEKQRLENELGTDELTGLRNRRAFASDERLPVQAMLDVDSLKWVNDNLGHGAGDDYLRAVGEAMRRAGIGDRGYRLSGDEFAFQAHTPELADAMRQRLDDELAKMQVQATLPDGTVLTKQGVGVSYGRGATRAEADAGLYANKNERIQSGQRAPAGVEPPGVVRSAAEGLTSSVHVAAAVSPETRRAALSTAVAQMAEGRAPEVRDLVHADPRAGGEPATVADMQQAAARADGPEGGLLTRPSDSVREPEPNTADLPPDEALPKAEEEAQDALRELSDTMTGIRPPGDGEPPLSALAQATSDAEAETWALVAGLPPAMQRELAEFDELAKDADTYSRALRAAASCEMRT